MKEGKDMGLTDSAKGAQMIPEKIQSFPEGSSVFQSTLLNGKCPSENDHLHQQFSMISCQLGSSAWSVGI